MTNNKHIYFLIIDGKKSDPLTFDQLIERFVGENDLVWRKGIETWVKAKDLEELSEILILNPPPIPPDTSLTTPDTKIRLLNLVKNKSILLVLFLMFVLFILIIFQGSDENESIQVQTDSGVETIDNQTQSMNEEISLNNESFSNDEMQIENKSKLTLPKNYFLSKNSKIVYVFDDVHKFWWSKSLFDDPSEVLPKLTKEEMDFVMSSEYKTEINGWHIQTFQWVVDMLNEQYKKQGKIYPFFD